MHRRALMIALACLPWTQARPATIPDHTAIRKWAVTPRAGSHADRAASFEREVGAFPYRFRSALDRSTVTAVDLTDYGDLILADADGRLIA